MCECKILSTSDRGHAEDKIKNTNKLKLKIKFKQREIVGKLVYTRYGCAVVIKSVLFDYPLISQTTIR